jgi:putative methionine-R-sulfoxide reductase with GAF domain
LTDALWDALSPGGVSWIGFYFFEPRCMIDPSGTRPAEDGMLLGPCRNKPACSPIGLHGACGRSYLTRRSLVVTDVKRLGANYVACDPRDQSELVVPLLDEHGHAVGVLDADSFDIGAFTRDDAAIAARLLHDVGLLRVEPSSVLIDVV